MRKSRTAPSQSPTLAGRPCVATSNCPYHFFPCQLSPANSGLQFDTVPYRAARRLVGTTAGVGEDLAEGSVKIVVGKGSSNKRLTATEQAAAWVNRADQMDTKAHAGDGSKRCRVGSGSPLGRHDAQHHEATSPIV